MKAVSALVTTVTARINLQSPAAVQSQGSIANNRRVYHDLKLHLCVHNLHTGHCDLPWVVRQAQIAANDVLQ